MTDRLERLQRLFMSLCDGEWEHGLGITIENLDNPGWTIRIALNGTPFEKLDFESHSIERSEHDWLHLSIKHDAHDRLLQASCGPLNLAEMLDAVLDLLRQPA
jgi:hypothetical protein